jgi:hypothetical protein
MTYKTELRKGIKVESEHKKTYELLKALSKRKMFPSKQIFYKSIALDHLEGEDPRYYDKLKKAGL